MLIILIIIGISVSAFASLFFYRYTKIDINVNENEYSYVYNNYTNDYDLSHINDIIEKYDINEIDINYKIQHEMTAFPSEIVATSKSLANTYGQRITNQDIETGNNVIVLSGELYSIYYKEDIMGSEIDLMGEIFEVIGFIDDNRSYIPYTYTINSDSFELTNLRLSCSNSLNKLQLNDIASKLGLNYQGSLTLNSEYIITGLMYLVLCIVLCFLNIYALLKYYLNKNIFAYTIYQICGASLRTIKISIIAETLLYMVLGLAIGISVNFALSAQQNLIFEDVIKIKWYDVLIICAINTNAMIMNLVLLFRRFKRYTPQDNRRWIK